MKLRMKVRLCSDECRKAYDEHACPPHVAVLDVSMPGSRVRLETWEQASVSQQFCACCRKSMRPTARAA